MSETRLPEVVIVGRPNVGKSTLFNRVLGRRLAIVGKQSGLTRDQHIATSDWRGRHFRVSDTGGVEWESADELLRRIQDHAFRALESADVVVFMVDALAGLMPVEAELAQELRRRDLEVVVAVNKCDSDAAAAGLAAEFHGLGVPDLFPISAEHGIGVADLLDHIVDRLPPGDEEARVLPDGTIRVAVVGRPNVGKSSLVNAMLGTQRVMVSEVSGTTRDAIDTLMEHDGRPYLLIDTAGIRRGGRREGFAEIVSVSIARERMRRAQVALLVVDATVGLSRQDIALAAEAGKSGCALVVVVNKWDLIDVESGTGDRWKRELKERMGRIGFASIAYTSAKTGRGVAKLFPLIDYVESNRSRRVPTGELNAFFARLLRSGAQGPPGSPTLKYMTQAETSPPTFVFFVSGGKGDLPDNFTRYLENRLRERFEFDGSPIRLRIRRSGQLSGSDGPR